MSLPKFSFHSESSAYWDEDLRRSFATEKDRLDLSQFFSDFEDYMEPVFFSKKRYPLPLRPPILSAGAVTLLNAVNIRIIDIFESLVLRSGPLFDSKHPFAQLQRDSELFMSRKISPYLFSRRFGRPDFVVSGNHPYLLELNSHSNIDPAPELELMARWYLLSPSGSKTSERFSLSALACLETLASAFKFQTSTTAPKLAVLDCDKNRGFFPAMMSLHGVPSAYVHVSEISHLSGKLQANGLNADIYLKDFTSNYLQDEVGEPILENLRQISRQEKTFSYADDSVQIISDKRLFALAWESRDSLSDLDRDILEKYTPASFLIESGKSVSYRGKSEKLESLLDAKNKDHFLIKLGAGQEGKDVFCGKDTTPAEWEKLAAVALRDRAGEYILQEFKKSDTLELPTKNDNGDGIAAQKVQYVLSQYLVDQKPSIGFFRYVPVNGDSVINYARGALRSVVLGALT